MNGNHLEECLAHNKPSVNTALPDSLRDVVVPSDMPSLFPVLTEVSLFVSVSPMRFLKTKAVT